jgi:hypothetical protein
MMKVLAGVSLYILCILLFAVLYRKVKNNIGKYDEIPNQVQYRNSIFDIGGYETPYSERSRHSFREALFYLVGTVICYLVLMAGMIGLNIWNTKSIRNYLGFSNTGILVSSCVLLFLSVVYVNVFLFMKNPFITSVCLCQTRQKRGTFLKKRMLLCLVCTIVLMPFALLGTDNYVYITNQGIYENKFFSFEEEGYLYDDIQNVRMEKRYDKEGNISDICCYLSISNTEINVINSDWNFEMIQQILQEEAVLQAEITGDTQISEEEAQALIDGARTEDERKIRMLVLYEWR